MAIFAMVTLPAPANVNDPTVLIPGFEEKLQSYPPCTITVPVLDKVTFSVNSAEFAEIVPPPLA